MPTVSLELPHHAYDIRIEPGLVNQLGDQVKAITGQSRAALFVDTNIEASHGRVAARSMKQADIDTIIAVVPEGETNKTLGTVRGLYEVMLEAKLERRSPVIALGGGITGDTVGFVASTYLRGVPFIQVPTTLLSMVDASVGGKVGVNVPQGKNLIGSFYQPELVVIDPEVLRTLPDREIRCGLAECIKHGVIRDPDLFHWIIGHARDILNIDTDTISTLVERNVKIKADVVVEDEKEHGVRAHLNFGHTFAHAIENVAYGELHHGEAVGLGMLAATRMAIQIGLCPPELEGQLYQSLEAVGLPTSMKKLPASDEMIVRMQMDKKVRDGKIRLVLPERLGSVVVTDEYDPKALALAWESLRKK